MACVEPDSALLFQEFVCLRRGKFVDGGGEFVRTVQRAQSLPIAIVEEVAFENGWITRGQLMESAERYGKSPYGQHLKGIADGEIMLVPNQKNRRN